MLFQDLHNDPCQTNRRDYQHYLKPDAEAVQLKLELFFVENLKMMQDVAQMDPWHQADLTEIYLLIQDTLQVQPF